MRLASLDVLVARPKRRGASRAATAWPRSSSCIQTVEPWPSWIDAVSSAALRPVASTARQRVEIDLVRLRGDRRTATSWTARTIGSALVRSRDLETSPRQVDVAGCSSCQMSRVSGTVRRASTIVSTAPEPAKPGASATASARLRRLLDRADAGMTAVAPPWSTTQSSTPSAARKSRQPCSLMPPTSGAYRRVRTILLVASPEPIPPDLFLSGYSPEIRDLADRLRSVVHEAVPEAIERVRTGWRLIGYDVPAGRRTRYFAFVAPGARARPSRVADTASGWLTRTASCAALTST